MTKKFPARYFLIRLELENGQVIDFDKAQWDAQFIPRSAHQAEILLLPTHWAFARAFKLTDVVKGLRVPALVKNVQYSIMCHNEKAAHWEHFQHPFNPKNKTMLTRDSIVCTRANLFKEYPLSFLMGSKKMKGQKAIQFIS